MREEKAWKIYSIMVVEITSKGLVRSRRDKEETKEKKVVKSQQQGGGGE